MCKGFSCSSARSALYLLEVLAMMLSRRTLEQAVKQPVRHVPAAVTRLMLNLGVSVLAFC
jgi:hypothetical protein